MPLHLLPNLLGQTTDHTLFFPRSVDMAVATLDGLIAESDRGGRHFLRLFKKHLPIVLLNEHTRDFDFLLEGVYKGENWGVVSDAGLPCLADPGAELVKRAQAKKIPVYTYPGPSSLTYALILSGLPSQAFAFHGYIAKDQEGRKKDLKKWSLDKEMTHIFIETPYRNAHTLQSCIETLPDKTILCVAWDLTMPSQGVETMEIAKWKKGKLPQLETAPAIFLFRYYI